MTKTCEFLRKILEFPLDSIILMHKTYKYNRGDRPILERKMRSPLCNQNIDLAMARSARAQAIAIFALLRRREYFD